MALHVPELRMMMFANESSADIYLTGTSGPRAHSSRVALRLNGLGIECRGKVKFIDKALLTKSRLVAKCSAEQQSM